MSKIVLIALGSNVAGHWGPPVATLRRTLIELRRRGVRTMAASHMFRTPPISVLKQPDFYNAVIAVATGLPPLALLALCKCLEREAGRVGGRRHGPRPLDLDIICHGDRVLGWSVRGPGRRKLVLPHPEAHRRAFVLRPLLEVAPGWMHPVLRRSGQELLGRLRSARHDVVELATPWHPPRCV